jgi:hypothetical protein
MVWGLLTAQALASHLYSHCSLQALNVERKPFFAEREENALTVFGKKVLSGLFESERQRESDKVKFT